jgi:hypothetical protein
MTPTVASTNISTDEKYVFQNCRIVYRNFRGEESQFNTKGNRNFCLVLDSNKADILKTSGWTVKPFKKKDDEELVEQLFYTQVKLNYNGTRPPRIYMISKGHKQLLDVETVSVLDYAEIEKVDLHLVPYEWTPGRFKGYVKTMFVTLVDDPLELLYEKEEKEE